MASYTSYSLKMTFFFKFVQFYNLCQTYFFYFLVFYYIILIWLFNMNGYIKWQNHNYAVDPTSLPEGVEVTHINLNDGSCAGLAFPAQKIMSLQYPP